MKKIRKNLKWITLGVVLIIGTIVFAIKYTLISKETKITPVEELEIIEEKEEKEETVKEKNENITVYVDIKGAVQKPGVYQVDENKKVIDVVELAGGFTEEANTSMINLAKKVANEMVIIIYTEEEVKQANEKDTVIKIIEKECVCPEINNDACINQENNNENTTNNANGQININTATIDELLTLTGIGESKAKTIIEYREEFGFFETIEDIMKVPGIGEALYEKIKNNITV